LNRWQQQRVATLWPCTAHLQYGLSITLNAYNECFGLGRMFSILRGLGPSFLQQHQRTGLIERKESACLAAAEEAQALFR
jgi:hypothetical protein